MTRRSGLRFDLAGPADDAELRSLLRETPMSGPVELAFLREPDYFRAAGICGSTIQTIVARKDGRIAGMGTRALRRAWINGEAVEAGYLGDLRLRPEFRGGTLLARGYRFLRELDRDGRAEVYATVIVEDNSAALSTIAAGRAGLPRYTDMGRILTPLLHVPRRSRSGASPAPGEEVEAGSPRLLGEIVRKLNENRLQFAPVWEEEDFLPGKLPGFRVEDFRILRREGRIGAVMGLWDQRSFRQVVALRYHGMLGVLRPLINQFRRPPLPAPGTPLPLLYAAFISTDDAAAFRALLRRVLDEVSRGPLAPAFLVAGLHERDPRAAVLEEFRRASFAGRLFVVTFEGRPHLDGRVPCMEAALL